MFKWVNKGIKKMSWYDISMIKLSVAVFVLFIISFLSNGFIDKIKALRWLWLAIFILAAIIPMTKFLKK